MYDIQYQTFLIGVEGLLEPFEADEEGLDACG